MLSVATLKPEFNQTYKKAIEHKFLISSLACNAVKTD